MSNLKANIKYLKSFLKKDWEFKDYPLETLHNTEAEDITFSYRAKLTLWWNLVAFESTESQAVSNLKKEFLNFKKENANLPRPGAKVPIRFSERTKVEKYEAIAIDFFDKIIGISFHDCFISDFSTLFDFDLENEVVLKNIEKEYGIVPKNKDYYLVTIFEQIEEKNL